MPADEHHKPAASAPPLAPTSGAHHGPGDQPGLSETLGAFVNRLKQKGILSSRVLGIAVIVLVAIFVWRYIASQRGKSQSREWVDLGTASSVASLEAVAGQDAGDMAGKLANVLLTRYRLDQGIQGLKAMRADEQQKGIENVEKARDEFKALAETFKSDPIQHPACLWGQAKAEEALIGVPKAGNAVESRGEVAKAAEYYTQVAEAAANTPLGEMAKAKAENLKANANVIKALQSDLYKPLGFGSMPNDDIHRGMQPPSLPGLPGLPGGMSTQDPFAPVVPQGAPPQSSSDPTPKEPAAPAPKAETPAAPTPPDAKTAPAPPAPPMPPLKK